MIHKGAVGVSAEKRISLKISFVLKAVAVAMGVGSIVLSVLQTGKVEQICLLLGIGLGCLAISTLND